MSFDIAHNDNIAKAIAAERAKALTSLQADRQSRDARETASTLANRLGRTVIDGEAAYQAWIAGEDKKLVRIELPNGRSSWQALAPDQKLDPAIKVVEEISLLAAIDTGVEQRARARAFFGALTGGSAGLATKDSAILAADAAAQKEYAAALQADVEKTVPAKTIERLRGYVMAPELRATLEKAITDGDRVVLDSTLVTKRTVTGPTGARVDVVEVKEWHYTENPRIADPQERMRLLGAGGNQLTVAELQALVRNREILAMRFGEDAMADLPPHMNGSLG